MYFSLIILLLNFLYWNALEALLACPSKPYAIQLLSIECLLMTYVVHHFDLNLTLIRPHWKTKYLGRGCHHKFAVLILYRAYRETAILSIVGIVIIN